MDRHFNADSRGTGGQSAREWMAKGIVWVAKSGGKTLGQSVRAMKKTGAMVTGAQRTAAKTVRASQKAAGTMLVSTLAVLPKQIAIGNRIRTCKHIRRLQREKACLRKKMRRKAVTPQGDKRTSSIECEEIQKLSETIKLREVEIAELRDKLETGNAQAKVQAVSKGPKRQIQAMAATPAVSESAVTAEPPAIERPKPKPLEAEAPVVDESVAEPVGTEALIAPGSGAQAPEHEEEPSAVEQVQFLLEEAAQHADFDLASEKLVFQRAVQDVQSTDPALIEAAMGNLKRIKNPAVTRVLGLLAKDPREGVRAHSLTVLTEQEEEGAVPLFEEAVKDSSVRVRMAALRGLYKLGCGRAIPHFMKALEDEDAGVRHRAVTCLSWAGVPEAIPNMLPLLQDSDTVVRKAVVDALGNLESRLGVPGLIQALGDKDVRVRRAAHRTLKNLTHHTIVFGSEACCEHGSEAKAQWEAWWKVNRATFQLG